MSDQHGTVHCICWQRHLHEGIKAHTFCQDKTISLVKLWNSQLWYDWVAYLHVACKNYTSFTERHTVALFSNAVFYTRLVMDTFLCQTNHCCFRCKGGYMSTLSYSSQLDSSINYLTTLHQVEAFACKNVEEAERKLSHN
jgi:hypothetical protein